MPFPYMNKLIIIAIVLLGIYLITPVPYCKIMDEKIEEDVTYSDEEIRAIDRTEISILHVTGTSMTPTIQDNSECICTQQNSYKLGDIIFFFAKLQDKWVGITHRIVLIDYQGITTKGDNNNFLDKPMQKENIYCSIPSVPRYKVLF